MYEFKRFSVVAKMAVCSALYSPFALSYDLTHDFAQLARKGVLNVLRGVPPK